MLATLSRWRSRVQIPPGTLEVRWTMFVRFVVGTNSENPYWLDGVFGLAYRLRDDEALGEGRTEWLAEILEWFNRHLPVPPFGGVRARRRWSDRVVCWFRGERNEPLRRMWPLVELLRDDGTPVRVVTTSRPGRILYEDSFQIVAETPGLREQDWRLVPRRYRTQRSR